MKAVFYGRDFSEIVDPFTKETKVTVERYSWHMIGGPKTAIIKVSVTSDQWDTMSLLRAPVEIYGKDGKLVWWGYVNRVTVPHGPKQSYGLGLNEVYNSVVVRGENGDTAAGTDDISIGEFGTKEKILTDGRLDSTNAEAKRDLYLQEHAFAKQENELNGGVQEISIECYGWFSTLGWEYYTDPITSDAANETLILYVLTLTGQFINGLVLTDASGLTSSRYRDGTRTSAAVMSDLLAAGTSNTQPYIAYVDKDRYLHVNERTAQPSEPEYLLSKDNKLITKNNFIIPDQECKVGVWAKPKGVPATLGGFSAMSSFFIESAEYNVAQDETTYKAAGAYEQLRLSKYVGSVINNDGGGNYETFEPGDVYNIYNPRIINSYIQLETAGDAFSAAAYTVLWNSKTFGLGEDFTWPFSNNANVRLLQYGFFIASFQFDLDSLTEGDKVTADFHPWIRGNEFPTTYADSAGLASLTFSSGVMYRSGFQQSFLTINATSAAEIVNAYMQIAFIEQVSFGSYT